MTCDVENEHKVHEYALRMHSHTSATFNTLNHLQTLTLPRVSSRSNEHKNNEINNKKNRRHHSRKTFHQTCDTTHFANNWDLLEIDEYPDNKKIIISRRKSSSGNVVVKAENATERYLKVKLCV